MALKFLVTVTRNLTNNFYRSGLDQIDEAEIFEGAEHKLTMEQMYTWEFQCKYQLQRYPFDTQVQYNWCIRNLFNLSL